MKCVCSLKVFTFNKYLKKLEISRGDISLELNRRDQLTIYKNLNQYRCELKSFSHIHNCNNDNGYNY